MIGRVRVPLPRIHMACFCNTQTYFWRRIFYPLPVPLHFGALFVSLAHWTLEFLSTLFALRFHAFSRYLNLYNRFRYSFMPQAIDHIVSCNNRFLKEPNWWVDYGKSWALLHGKHPVRNCVEPSPFNLSNFSSNLSKKNFKKIVFFY